MNLPEPLKARLQRGEMSYGPFMKLAEPAAVEVFALAGFDHVIIDMEHGPLSVETAQNLVRAGRLHGLAPLIRVPRNDASEILRALDIGAEGVHVPQINSAEAAREAVDACYFHPLGHRGVCRFVRAAEYTHIPSPEHFAGSNERVLPVLHIEGQAGVAALPQILEVPNLGVVFLGPYDLSQSCGVPGEVTHPLVVEKMREAVALARSRGVVVGTFVDNAERARVWREAGVGYICYSVDVGLLYEKSAEVVKALRG
jgi:4-hydroxy-2-oxoheptanedioate aldolase